MKWILLIPLLLLTSCSGSHTESRQRGTGHVCIGYCASVDVGSEMVKDVEEVEESITKQEKKDNE